MARAEPTLENGSGAAPARAPVETIVVDLDRTLISTDMTLECLLAFIGRHPLEIPKLIGWGLSGRSRLKDEVGKRSAPNPATVPLNPEVIDYLRAKKAEGAHLVLASASNEGVVNAIAQEVGLFDEVIGSTAQSNLKGTAKAAELDRRYGSGNYTYVGDSPADLKVWARAGKAVTVGTSRGLRKKVEDVAPAAEHIDVAARQPGTFFANLLREMRPHQWSKNILIFVPLLAAHAFSLQTFVAALLAFLIFSLTASSVYLINDMVDLDADRAHPRKRLRPFASGRLALKDGLIAAPLLLVCAIGLGALLLPPLFMLVLAGYFLATLSYSLWLKQKVMVDVFLLAGLYTFRILAGGAATGIPMSPWLLGFSLFFFLALAIVKRVAELVDIIESKDTRESKRDYTAIDLGTVQSLGAAAGYASILVLTFYFTSPEATELYDAPVVLWAVGPLMLFWISRMLVLASRGHMDDDPIVFAAKDRTSLIVGACVAATILLAVFL